MAILFATFRKIAHTRIKSFFNMISTNHWPRFVKRYVAKSSSQRPLHDQILSYQSMLDLCGKEIPYITFFGVSQEEMVNVRADQEDRFAKSKTVPGTSSSHHFLPIYCSKIAHTRIKSFFNMISTNHWPRFVKRYVAKSSSQRPLHDQILSYQSMLDLCGKEIPYITFFGVSQEEMVNVRADQEDRFAKSKTVPGTSSSHHFLPIYCSKIAHTRIKSFFDMISTNHWPKK